MSVEIYAVYEGSLHCVATHGPSQNSLVTDAPVDNGGSGSAFSPTDLVATALGTCVLTTMGLVAARHDVDLSTMTVRVIKEMTTQPVRRIASLVTEVKMPAGIVTESSMRERLEAAARKCPVHASLHPDIDAPIKFIYQ